MNPFTLIYLILYGMWASFFLFIMIDSEVSQTPMQMIFNFCLFIVIPGLPLIFAIPTRRR